MRREKSLHFKNQFHLFDMSLSSPPSSFAKNAPPPSRARDKDAAKKTKRRFAIVDCEDDVELAYVAVAFSRLLSASGTDEIWEHHRVPEGELPNMREIDTYDGIVITGSRHSAMDAKSMRWMKHLKQFLERVANLSENAVPRIFAVNFGAHVLCEALGGKIRRRNGNNSNEEEEEEEESDVIGKFTCEFDLKACEKAFSTSVWSRARAIVEEKKRMKMISRQRDEICELPEGAVVLTNAVVNDESNSSSSSSSDEDNETRKIEKEEAPLPKPESVFQPVPHEFSKFIPERQKPKVAEKSTQTRTTNTSKEENEDEKKKETKTKRLTHSNEAVCCWAWSPTFDDEKSKARVLAWQHTLLLDEGTEDGNKKKKKDRDVEESDPSIAFLSLARAFLRSKNESVVNDDGVSHLRDTKTSLSECLRAARETIEAKSLDQWRKKSIARGEDENNVIHHDKNQVVVLDKMEFVAEQAFLATARAVKSELDYASEEFRLYSALNEVSKNAFERCAKDLSDVRVFAEKIADTETKIHSCIVPTIEALEEQVELFEATVRNAEKKCDEIDARIAQLHV